MVGDIISEQWAELPRNGGRIIPESWAASPGIGTGDRRCVFDCGSKGRDACFDLPIDHGDGCIESIDLIEMKTQQETMVRSYPPNILPKAKK